MAVIKKIKIPGETLPRDIGVNSSNVVYDGDSGTTTTLNSKIQSIFTAIGDINSFEIALVNALPTENIDDHTIYFVPNSQDANTRDEYMYVGNQWEMIGSTTIDLSDYPTYDDISIVQGLTTGIPAATITVGATTTTIYAPEETDPIFTSSAAYGITPTNITNWNNKADRDNLSIGYVLNDVLYVPSNSKYSEGSDGDDRSGYFYFVIPSKGATSYNRPIANTKISDVMIGDTDISLISGGITITESGLYRGYISGNELTYEKVPTINDIPASTSVTVTQSITTGIEIGSIDVNGTTTTFYAPKTYEVEITEGNFIEEESSYNNDVYDGSFANSNDSLASIIQKINDGYNVVVLCNEQILRLAFINSEPGEIDFSMAAPGGIITGVAIYTENSEDIIRIYHTISPTGADVWYEPYTGLTPGIAGTIHYNNDSADITYQNDKVFQQAETSLSFGNDSYILYSKNSNNETNQVYKRSNVKILADSSIKVIDSNDNTCIYGPTEIRFYHKNVNKTLSIKPDINVTGVDSNAYIANKYSYEIIPIGSSINVGSTTTPVYLSNGELLACTLPTIPSITATAGLTTGVTIGAIDINGVTTTLYAPEDTKVTQTDITGSTENVKYPVLLSAQTITAGTITDTSIKTDSLQFRPDINRFIVKSNGTSQNGGISVSNNSRNQVIGSLMIPGTSATYGVSAVQIGNQYTTNDGEGNSRGSLILYGKGNVKNNLYILDDTISDVTNKQYSNYLPMVNEVVLAAGVTTGVGSSTVPVYMASTGELIACSLPAPVTPPTYSLSMTGPTINLLADEVAASTITLPIYDGTVIEAAEGGSY